MWHRPRTREPLPIPRSLLTAATAPPASHRCRGRRAAPRGTPCCQRPLPPSHPIRWERRRLSSSRPASRTSRAGRGPSCCRPPAAAPAPPRPGLQAAGAARKRLLDGQEKAPLPGPPAVPSGASGGSPPQGLACNSFCLAGAFCPASSAYVCCIRQLLKHLNRAGRLLTSCACWRQHGPPMMSLLEAREVPSSRGWSSDCRLSHCLQAMSGSQRKPCAHPRNRSSYSRRGQTVLPSAWALNNRCLIHI